MSQPPIRRIAGVVAVAIAIATAAVAGCDSNPGDGTTIPTDAETKAQGVATKNAMQRYAEDLKASKSAKKATKG